MRNYFSLLVIFISLFGCGSGVSTVYQASDFVYVGSFTSGLEGPAVDKDGNLFFVNPDRNGTIGRVTTEGQFDLYIDSLPNGSIANGIRFDQNGLMFLADYVNHNVLTIDPVHQKVVTYANDSTMNQPNDLAIRIDGKLYASDPNWSEGTGNLWRIDTGGQFVLLESHMGTTNGIEVAPGDSILYVNESVQRRIWRYNLDSTGDISNKRLFIEFSDYGLDGMRTDVEGNLFVCRYGKGTVAMISPKGKLIREVQLTAEKPTNITFGGNDGRSCFVTCQDRGFIESFRAEHPGRGWQLIQ